MRKADIRDVFDPFAAITLQEAEERVAWLEDALARWRTVLIIKQLDARRPPDLSEVTPLHKPLIECSQEERQEEFPETTGNNGRQRETKRETNGDDRRRGPRDTPNRRKIQEFLREQPEGAPLDMIAISCGISYNAVNSQVQQWAGKDYHRIDGKWYLTDVIVAKIVEAIRAHGGRSTPMQIVESTGFTAHKVIEVTTISPRLVTYSDKSIAVREEFAQPMEGDEPIHNGNGRA